MQLNHLYSLLRVLRNSQVVKNMCTNAFKFVAHDGTGHVTLRAKLLKTRSGDVDDVIPVSLAPSKAAAAKLAATAGESSVTSPILLRPKMVAIVRVEVEDNGCGIAEAEIPKVIAPLCCRCTRCTRVCVRWRFSH